MREATSELEKQLDLATKLLSLAAKVGLLTGGTCIVSYLLGNGHYPQGLSIGDSLLFLVAAFCFGVICLYFSASVTAAGVLLAPLFVPVLRFLIWLTTIFRTEKSKPELKLQKITLLTVLFGICGVVTIYFLARKNPIEHIPLILLPIFQYIVYSAFLNQNRKINTAYQPTPEIAGTEPFDKAPRVDVKPMKRLRAMIAGLIILTPILMGGVTSDLLQTAMSLAKIRIERATILVKPPYANLLPDPKDSPLQDYKVFENATVVFRGVGNSTLIEMRTADTAIRLEIPNDSIIIERKTRLITQPKPKT
ncbi:hypothetical protein LOY64_14090 [Pseudomonas corrugata]|uniref:Uncharacterized protein n=1 Tax=Pseudomonas corrugata TaxID=47879 RepID=A0A3M3EBM1_9PSED|nr:hypothetical protein [Pseudomonas corrugata]MDU9025113.1 hypothetical protein [Pseudomonas corrugata]RMM46990.1 hypothetical protein ALQ77_00685 [Pseudomonas corrugata]UZD98065.1 hypothetical protein LOY64_14090 [Pseudomonas corrugata]SDU95751.1 hypothetical protein SAMN04490183_2205 [Pseudomonas corrugata]